MSPSSAKDKEKPKRRRIGADARHKQLIDIAEGVFIREGYDRASMEQIADEAGVTRTLVYQHFSAKKDLYMAVIERVIPEFIRRVVPPEEERPKHPWILLAGFRQFLTLLQDEGSTIKLLMGERPHDPWIAERLDGLSTTFLEHFEREYEGTAPKPYIRLVAICYLGIIEAVSRSWPSDGALDLDAEEMSQALAQFMWGGMRTFDLPKKMVDEQYVDEPPEKWRPNMEYLEVLAEKVPGAPSPSKS